VVGDPGKGQGKQEETKTMEVGNEKRLECPKKNEENWDVDGCGASEA